MHDAPTGGGRRRLILLVEDDPDDILLIRRAFARANLSDWTVLDLHTGQLAIDYLGGHGAYSDRGLHPLPAVVLLDTRLPRRSGAEVLKFINADAELARLQVVMLCASTLDCDVAHESGVSLTLLKPVQPEMLAEVLRQAEVRSGLHGWEEGHGFRPGV